MNDSKLIFQGENKFSKSKINRQLEQLPLSKLSIVRTSFKTSIKPRRHVNFNGGYSLSPKKGRKKQNEAQEGALNPNEDLTKRVKGSFSERTRRSRNNLVKIKPDQTSPLKNYDLIKTIDARENEQKNLKIPLLLTTLRGTNKKSSFQRNNSPDSKLNSMRTQRPFSSFQRSRSQILLKRKKALNNFNQICNNSIKKSRNLEKNYQKEITQNVIELKKTMVDNQIVNLLKPENEDELKDYKYIKNRGGPVLLREPVANLMSFGDCCYKFEDSYVYRNSKSMRKNYSELERKVQLNSEEDDKKEKDAFNQLKMNSDQINRILQKSKRSMSNYKLKLKQINM